MRLIETMPFDAFLNGVTLPDASMQDTVNELGKHGIGRDNQPHSFGDVLYMMACEDMIIDAVRVRHVRAIFFAYMSSQIAISQSISNPM